MPTTKHELLDWLMDVPEDAEIGTDGQGLALLAILGTNVHLLEVGHIPNADELYAEAINQAMMERLRRIDAAGGETEIGVIIVTLQGYISGIPTLFSTGFTSHILAEVESSNEGEYRWGHNMLTIADCRRKVQIEFFLGTKRERRRSLAKINLLISILTRFREVLTKEIALIEKAKAK